MLFKVRLTNEFFFFFYSVHFLKDGYVDDPTDEPQKVLLIFLVALTP